ncbi:hypothetical protein PISMIDRAFT_7954 [Pisolithus microcarpus 441]|uniref:Uncharacterized protein n=1 Tax=Pisolithus microcarpus 441 TaxID=765257 RepID=A0A0C9ZPQ4_9AGAM|nr:hypothetical protein PISMIDRAFT_7954 [Pisolithus microcarpus 441]
MSSDNEATYGVGRRAASSSSRESSPVLKRQRRSFTPHSDDGDLVIPVTNDGDEETPEPRSAPLIRKPVGFSWTPSTAAAIETYEAALPPKPTSNYFLPGQAPPPPPKQPKRRSNRKKKGQEYSAQTGRFRISAPTNGLPMVAVTHADPPSASLSGGPMAANAGSPAGNLTANPQIQPLLSPSNPNPAAGVAPGISVCQHSTSGERTTDYRNSANAQTASRGRNKQSAGVDSHDSRSSFQPATLECPTHEVLYDRQSGPVSTERISSSIPLPTRNTPGPSSSIASVGSSTARDCSAMSQRNNTDTQCQPRMVTLLIEDYRSGVQDSQLAEITVPLKAAENSEDGFWADAVDVCDALQATPSRIDGPAKVYTKRAKYRQFFMRVDQHDNHHTTPACLGVSKKRTLDVFVEAPVPQGQLPRPPRCPTAFQLGHRSDSDSDLSMSCTGTRSSTRDERIEAFPEVYHATFKRRSSQVSDNKMHKRKRGWGSTSPVTPLSITSHSAETEEERDGAITKWVRPQVESHPEFPQYVQSKANLQSVSEVLKQFDIVDLMSRQLSGLTTPADCAGAPYCSVKRDHILRSLGLDAAWDKRWQEISTLVSFYGKNGTRYEDSRVVDVLNSAAVAEPNVIERFFGLLKSVHQTFTAEGTRNTASQSDSAEE